jgi:hypothetical protein
MSTVTAKNNAFQRRLLDFLDFVEYRRADAEEDREPIYRLRYEAYKRDNNISAGFTANSGDAFDDAENCHVFGLYITGKLVSSVRVNILSWKNPVSPTMSIFSDLLEPRIKRGETFVDPSRFVIDTEARTVYPELVYATLRLVPMAARYFHSDYCLATVRPEHNAFYKKVFLLDLMSEPRLYPSLSKPVNMLGGRMTEIYDRAIARYPIIDSHYIEQRMMFNSSHWPVLPARHVPMPVGGFRPALETGAIGLQ